MNIGAKAFFGVVGKSVPSRHIKISKVSFVFCVDNFDPFWILNDDIRNQVSDCTVTSMIPRQRHGSLSETANSYTPARKRGL
ncbi:MAG: hypothetical protein B9S26_14800 [Opitutia bacterium Tous-C4FEB]|nr:MAG: hypothetical protein B9S35_12425 [Opitutae bacterium Tous-C5TDCM]PAW87088.1 MAG: hypothetical protein B9S26_14800 [Opitutae bacterium Tous-C4FEB]